MGRGREDWLIDDIEKSGEVTTQTELATRPVSDFDSTNGRNELTAEDG
jgi:hypothetical protein